jgi:site-specific DNA-methyltransferase (adenine-specific)
MERIVLDVTDKDASVVDPFMGSGTTGIACAKHKRKFVGIEIDERYFDFACERIANMLMQPRLL